jgi:hypothetical protein
MTDTDKTSERGWIGLFALLLVATALGAWGFGHSITVGVTAEEMGYNPVHDAAWASAHHRLEAAATADTRFTLGCFAIAVITAVMLFRSTARRKTSVSPIIAGLALVVGMGGALLIGLLD